MTKQKHHSVILELKLSDTLSAYLTHLQSTIFILVILTSYEASVEWLRRDDIPHQMMFFLGSNEHYSHSDCLCTVYTCYPLFLWIGYANSHGWKAICTCLCDVYADQQRETVRIVSRIISFANFATYMYMDFWFGLSGKEGVATGRLRVLQTAWTWTLPPHISRDLSRLPFLSYIIHILFSVTLRLSQAFVCSMFWIFMWLLIFICLRATFKVQTLRAWEHVWCDTDDKKKIQLQKLWWL